MARAFGGFHLILCLISLSVATDLHELSGKDRHKTRFQTEPNYAPTYIKIETLAEDASLLAPGYIFMDPVHDAEVRGRGGLDIGPEIREQDGTLVWYGGQVVDPSEDDASSRAKVQDFHVCDYKGVSGQHLCWSELRHGRRRKKLILDQGYNLTEKIVIPMQFGNHTEYPDLHEFNMVDNGNSLLQPFVPSKAWDLSVLGGPDEGCIVDGCMQEVRLDDHSPVFEWCLLDHLPVWDTTIFPTNAPNTTTNVTSWKVGSGAGFGRGDGALPDICYDAYHPNAFDKNFEGDYLFSVRHNNQILKIAGNNNTQGLLPGTIIWRLGGQGGNITFEDDFKPFGRQHHVRYINTTAEETIFSLFDNAWEGALKPTNEFSSGMVISVNNITNTARLMEQYPHPHSELSPSQGAFQRLPNDNVFIAWGSNSQFSEFSHDGQLLLHASYAGGTDRGAPEKIEGNKQNYTYSYRLFKSPWIGKPLSSPKLISYTQDCSRSSPLMAWVSWNGATEVASWRFYVANSAEGPWGLAGIWPRTGFETEADLSAGSTSLLGKALQSISFPRYVSVEALDSAGNVLENGEQIVETFVPEPKMRRQSCTPTGCFEDTGFDYDPEKSYGDRCGSSFIPQLMVLLFVIALIEYIDWLDLLLLDLLVRRRRYSSAQAQAQATSVLPTSVPGALGLAKYATSPNPGAEYHIVSSGARNSSFDMVRNEGSLTARPGYERTYTPGY